MDDPATLPEEEELTHSYLIKRVAPKTVFFRQDGIYAVLCDSLWEPQHGLAIIISDDGLSIDTQDEVL